VGRPSPGVERRAVAFLVHALELFGETPMTRYELSRTGEVESTEPLEEEQGERG